MSEKYVAPMPVDELRLLMQKPTVPETDEYRKEEMIRILGRACHIWGQLDIKVQADRALLDDLTSAYEDKEYFRNIAYRSIFFDYLKNLAEGVAWGQSMQIHKTEDQKLIAKAVSKESELHATMKKGVRWRILHNTMYENAMVDPLVIDVMAVDYSHRYLDTPA